MIRAKDAQYENGVIKLFGSVLVFSTLGRLMLPLTRLAVVSQVTIQSDSSDVAGQGAILVSSVDTTGGQIEISGQNVTLSDSARVDASDALGGGEVLLNAVETATFGLTSKS